MVRFPGEILSCGTEDRFRIGTPAVTTRGMKEAEMETIAELIDEVLWGPTTDSIIAGGKGRVSVLTAKFPLYPRS